MDAVLLCLAGQHDLRLVATAAAICLVSSVAVFDLRARIKGRDGRIRAPWLAATAFVAGLGIWATHFIAMLAYEPGPVLDFAVPMTVASGLLGMLLAGAAFAVAETGAGRGRLARAAAGGAVLGAGIAVLHYVGMAAAVFLGTLAWDGALVAWSVALGCLFGALSFVLASGETELPSVRRRAMAAGALTLAVCLHHFTGMAAVGIQAAAGMAGAADAPSRAWLVVAVAASTAAVLGFGVLGVAFDRAVERRTLREARLRIAQQAGGVATWEWLPASGALTWSETMPVLLGIADGRPSLDTLFRAVHPDDRAGLEAKLQAALRGEAPYDAEFRVIRAGDGAVRWLAGRGEVLRGEAGRPVRMVGVTYDVTERREAAEALARLNAELERRVAERTEQLVQLQKTEALGQMAGGVAHDFNNLLTIVSNSLDLARRRAGDPAAVKRHLDNAQQGVDRGAALTRRMLAFARKQELLPEAVDLSALTADLAPMLERALGSEVRLRLLCPAGLPSAVVDANQFELALLNLAVNARDAMKQPPAAEDGAGAGAGGGALTIALTAEPVGAEGGPDGLAPGRYLRLVVADTGRGMDEVTLRRATEPFFTTKGVGKGTGLGLSMVHGLCAQSGGRLVLASAPGQGTRAELWLPAAAVQAHEAAAPGEPAVPVPPPGAAVSAAA